MANFIVILVLLIVVGSACRYIYKNSKKGIKCVGCPYAASCNSAKAARDTKVACNSDTTSCNSASVTHNSNSSCSCSEKRRK